MITDFENKPAIGSDEWKIDFNLQTLDHQAQNGGKHQPDIESCKAKAGPYWLRKSWNNYCERVKEQLLKYGYPELDANQAITKATEKVKFID